MNAIDQFIDFIATLYTPKRALATLFMLTGCMLSLTLLLPYLNLLLEPALRPVTDEYKSYSIAIALCSGISAGIVLFNLLCGLWNSLAGLYYRHQQQASNKKQAYEAEQAKNIKLVANFKTAHAHLSAGKLSIIRRLLTVPTESYLTACPDIIFLEQAGWILPLAPSSNDESVYKINPVIQPIANMLWNEEVENNALIFMSNEQSIYQFIISAFTDLKSSTEIADSRFALYERHIKTCFDLQTITRHCYNLKFKLRYKEKFEELINQKLYSQRMFTIAESSEAETIP